MIVLVASTIAPYKVHNGEDLAWLTHAEEIRQSAPGCEVHFGAVLETDGRGLAPYGALLDRLDELDVHQWSFALDTGVREYGTHERLARITTGRNLIIEMANRLGAEWIHFVDSDVVAPPDSLPRLFEMCWPIVGGDVPDYVMSGPAVKAPEFIPAGASEKWVKRITALLEIGGGWDFPVMRRWTTAGFLLVHRDIFTHVRWRTDLAAGMTDDPCFAADAERLGWPTYVRRDMHVRQVANLVPVEQRGYDLGIRPSNV